jgi:uncharacterized protein YjiS (DUF1127 family)
MYFVDRYLGAPELPSFVTRDDERPGGERNTCDAWRQRRTIFRAISASVREDIAAYGEAVSPSFLGPETAAVTHAMASAKAQAASARRAAWIKAPFLAVASWVRRSRDARRVNAAWQATSERTLRDIGISRCEFDLLSAPDDCGRPDRDG